MDDININTKKTIMIKFTQQAECLADIVNMLDGRMATDEVMESIKQKACKKKHEYNEVKSKLVDDVIYKQLSLYNKKTYLYEISVKQSIVNNNMLGGYAFTAGYDGDRRITDSIIEYGNKIFWIPKEINPHNIMSITEYIDEKHLDITKYKYAK